MFIIVGNKSDLLLPGPTAATLGDGAYDARDHDADAEEAACVAVEAAAASTPAAEPAERTDMLVAALAKMRTSVLEQMATFAVQPVFLEVSAMRGDGLKELAAELGRGVLAARAAADLPARTGRRDMAHLIDPSAPTGPSAASCC